MYKTKNSIIKNITYAAIGTALSFTSIQVSARAPDNSMPSKLCFHINPDPNHSDDEGSYLILRSRQVGSIKLQGENLKLRQVNGLSIGRPPIISASGTLDGFEEEWVGNPITGTCHPHDNIFQCSLHSISSITTTFPANPLILSSIETARGDATIVYDRKNKSIVLAQRGEVDVTYFDSNTSNPIPEATALSLGLKTFKKISNFIQSPDIYEVRCRDVPHAEIPPFTIP